MASLDSDPYKCGYRSKMENAYFTNILVIFVVWETFKEVWLKTVYFMQGCGTWSKCFCQDPDPDPHLCWIRIEVVSEHLVFLMLNWNKHAFLDLLEGGYFGYSFSWSNVRLKIIYWFKNEVYYQLYPYLTFINLMNVLGTIYIFSSGWGKNWNCVKLGKK